MSTLAGKTLFITGASRGIGLAIAERAARDGANIVIAAKTTEAHPKLPGTIHSAAEEIEAAGVRGGIDKQRPRLLSRHAVGSRQGRCKGGGAYPTAGAHHRDGGATEVVLR